MKSIEQKKLKSSWKSWFLLPLIGLSGILTGCLNDSDNPPQLPAAYVSFYHGSPDSPTLDVHVDGTNITNQITYNPFQFSEVIPYSRFRIGKRNFQFTPVNSVTSLLDAEVTFEEDKIYSIFLADEMSNLQAFVLEDDWKNTHADSASIRFVHLSPDAGEVEVEVTGNENAFVDPASFLNDSEFEKFGKGSYTFTVRSNASGEVLVNATGVEIKGNRVYTLVLRGKKSLVDGDKKLNLQLVTNYIQY